MRYGNEVKVGLITLLAAALMITFFVYVRGFRAGARTYTLKVIFDNARGLQPGDPVRMVGVKIGKVRSVEISPNRKAVATLEIDRQVVIYDHYAFRVATSGLIQERFVEVIPADYSPEAKSLQDGEEVTGMLSPDLSDLMAAGLEVLENLNRTSRLLRSVLSDQEVLQGVKDALNSFADSANAASKLAQSVSSLADESRPELAATLKHLREAAADLENTTATVQARLDKTTAFDNFERAAQQAVDAAAKANQLLANLSELADPETRKQVKDTITATHDAAESLRVFTEELRKAAPAVPKVAQVAENVAQYSSALRERLKPPEIDAHFDVLYSSEAGRSFSSGALDFKTSRGRFLRLGIDDIGEDNSANIQIGDQQRRGVLRYGLVRSRLGFGLDYPLPNQATVSLDVLDPNNLRADLLADIPVIFGRSDLGVTVGIRDLGEDSMFVAGLRVRR